MKKTILRTLISAFLLSLISGIVVTIAGFILSWKTYTQFSDGFFLVGVIFIAIGFVNIWGQRNQDPYAGRQINSVIYVDKEETFKLWMSDLSHGYHLLAFLGISGLLMFAMAALAILIGRQF